MVKHDPIRAPTNHSRAGHSNIVPGMERKGLHQGVSSSSMPPPSGSSPLAASGKWDLLGSMDMVQSKDDPNNIHQGVGIDPTTLVLDLTSTSDLFKTFASPWAEEPLKEEPTRIPACYSENQPPHLNKLRLYSIFKVVHKVSVAPTIMSGQQSASENFTNQQSSGTNGQHNVHAFVNALSGIQLGHYGGPHQASDYPTNGGSGGSGNRNSFNIRAPARAQSHIHQVENGMSGASCSLADQYVARQTPQGPRARNVPGSSYCDFSDFLELPGTSNSPGGIVGQTSSSWVQLAVVLPPHLQPSFGLQDLHLALFSFARPCSRKNCRGSKTEQTARRLFQRPRA